MMARPQLAAIDALYRFLYAKSRMKTTLDLRDDLLARAKELAAKERTSLTRIIEQSLALRLRRQRAFRGKLKELPRSRRKGGLRAGIDPASNRSLFDAADA
jgi:predicted transcriptional regulator